MKRLYKIVLGSLVVAIPLSLFAYTEVAHYNEKVHYNHSKFEHLKWDWHNNNHKYVREGHNTHNQTHNQGSHFENEGRHEEPKSHLSNK